MVNGESIMEYRNKKKDQNRFGGLIGIKVYAVGLPMMILSVIHAGLTVTVGSAI